MQYLLGLVDNLLSVHLILQCLNKSLQCCPLHSTVPLGRSLVRITAAVVSQSVSPSVGHVCLLGVLLTETWHCRAANPAVV